MKILKRALPLLLIAALAACGQTGGPGGSQPSSGVQSEVSSESPTQTPEPTPTPAPTEKPPKVDTAYIDRVELAGMQIGNEALAMSAAADATIPEVLVPEHPGELTESNDRAIVDYSNTQDGYVMADFTGTTETRLKVIVSGPTTDYKYDMPVGQWVTLPLSDGNGDYSVKVYENVGGKNYATVLSVSFCVELADEFAPFLRPNRYVNYENAEKTIAKAQELAGKTDDPMEKVEAVYDYVIGNMTYDKEKAETVQTGYLPDLDEALETGKGICFDYAALMTGMLRSQGVPCKLVVGYAGSAYHAWISVWSESSGWVDGAVFFDGQSWQRMDPTFASTGKGEEWVEQFIGDGSNYSQKYLY